MPTSADEQREGVRVIAGERRRVKTYKVAVRQGRGPVWQLTCRSPEVSTEVTSILFATAEMRAVIAAAAGISEDDVVVELRPIRTVDVAVRSGDPGWELSLAGDDVIQSLDQDLEDAEHLVLDYLEEARLEGAKVRILYPGAVWAITGIARGWAEAVRRQLDRLEEVDARVEAVEEAALDGHEELPSWDSEGPLPAVWREQTAERHAPVWAAHQLDRWTVLLHRTAVSTPPPQDEVLKHTRDALEHLDDAQFGGGHAWGGGRGMDALGGRLDLDLSDFGVFARIDWAEVRARARALDAGFRGDADDLVRRAESGDWPHEP